MGNIINTVRINFFQEGMRRLYQIKTVIICALFLGIAYTLPHSYGQELVELAPKNLTCGQRLSIKISMLDKTKAYTLGIECSDLACTNPPGFAPTTYQIPLGSTSYIKEETFNVNSKCSTGQIKAPAGTYSVKLIETKKKTLLASSEFDLEDKTPSACQITSDQILESTQNATYTIQGKVGCTYKVSLIDPVGTRQPVEDALIPTSGKHTGTINKTLITNKGMYTITGIADSNCKELSVDDSECGSANSRVIDGTCTFSAQDKSFNCQQCPKGKVCSNLGKCEIDTVSSCQGKTETTKSLTQTDNVDVNKVKNSNTGILGRLQTANASSLLGLLMGMVIFGFMVYKVLAYRLRKD